MTVTRHDTKSRPGPWPRVWLCVLGATWLAACTPAAPAEERTPAAPPPAALAEAQADLPHLAVKLLDVARVSEGVIEVRFSLTNASDAPEPLAIEGLFASAPDDAGSVADVYLVDVAAGKKYFVVRDAAHRAVSSHNLEPVKPGESRVLWARVVAPPAGVSAVAVQIPHVPLFADIFIAPEGAGRADRRPPTAARGAEAPFEAGVDLEPVRSASRMWYSGTQFPAVRRSREPAAGL